MAVAESTSFRVDDRDWLNLTLGQKIQQIEVEGYLVIPDILRPEQVQRLRDLTDQLETTASDYSEKQRSRGEIHFDHADFAELIEHAPTLAFLTELCGPDIIFLQSVYALSLPGHPGVSLHTDGQPYGSAIFGYLGSCPVQVRVLYYLDDLTADVSPFCVVPRSHLSMHSDANPYTRYDGHREQTVVTARAGSAVFLNHRCFHGNMPNKSDRPRRMITYLYRPSWAGPTDEKIPQWDEQRMNSVPDRLRKWFVDRNVRHGFDFHHKSKPEDMRSDPQGISPSRWERD